MSQAHAIMLMNLAESEPILALQEKFPQYDPRAFGFVFGAIEFVVRDLPESRHISAAELSEGMMKLARAAFGLTAPLVLEGWGIKRSEDIGEIVFAMVEAELMGRQEEDRKEDFDGLFTIQERFAGEYEWPEVKTRLEAWGKESSGLKFG